MTLHWQTPSKPSHCKIKGYTVEVSNDSGVVFEKELTECSTCEIPEKKLLAGSKYCFYVKTRVKYKDNTKDAFESKGKQFVTSKKFYYMDPNKERNMAELSYSLLK